MYDLIKTTPVSSALKTIGSASQEGTEKWERRAGQQAHTWNAGASQRTIMCVRGPAPGNAVPALSRTQRSDEIKFIILGT